MRQQLPHLGQHLGPGHALPQSVMRGGGRVEHDVGGPLELGDLGQPLPAGSQRLRRLLWRLLRVAHLPLGSPECVMQPGLLQAGPGQRLRRCRQAPGLGRARLYDGVHLGGHVTDR